MKPFILICGLPGSGNRLFKNLFIAAGGLSLVRHGHQGERTYKKAFWIHREHPPYALIPVRHTHAESHSSSWGESQKMRTDSITQAMKSLSNLEIPTRMVGYETAFLYPIQTKRFLLEWVGLDPTTPWPDEPRDENAKWRCE